LGTDDRPRWSGRETKKSRGCGWWYYTLERIEAEFDVVSNPEFLREGSAVYDTFNPDRIVLGSNNPKAIEMMKELYAPLVELNSLKIHPCLPFPWWLRISVGGND